MIKLETYKMTACHIFCHGIIIDIKSLNLKNEHSTQSFRKRNTI